MRSFIFIVIWFSLSHKVYLCCLAFAKFWFSTTTTIQDPLLPSSIFPSIIFLSSLTFLWEVLPSWLPAFPHVSPWISHTLSPSHPFHPLLLLDGLNPSQCTPLWNQSLRLCFLKLLSPCTPRGGTDRPLSRGIQWGGNTFSGCRCGQTYKANSVPASFLIRFHLTLLFFFFHGEDTRSSPPIYDVMWSMKHSHL